MCRVERCLILLQRHCSHFQFRILALSNTCPTVMSSGSEGDDDVFAAVCGDVASTDSYLVSRDGGDTATDSFQSDTPIRTDTDPTLLPDEEDMPSTVSEEELERQFRTEPVLPNSARCFDILEPLISHIGDLAGKCMRQIKYASDCSGVDAPLFALEAVANTLKTKVDTDMPIKCVFQSEHPSNKAAIEFLKKNHSAECMLLDMNKRTQQEGLAEDGWRALPSELDIHTAGFECQQISNRNQASTPIKFDWKYMDDPRAGVSTQTFLKSVFTIHSTCPRVWLLENVNTLDVDHLLAFLKGNLEGYVIWSMRVNAADLGMCMESAIDIMLSAPGRTLSLSTPAVGWTCSGSSCHPESATPRRTC